MQKSIFSTKIGFIWYAVLLGLIFLLAIFVRLRNIGKPLLDAHFFRQTQTATVTRNFVRSGIDVFHTKLDLFGTGKEETLLLEFPLYQLNVAIVSSFFGFSDSLGRAVSIFWGMLGGLVLYLIVNEIFKNKFISIISTVFYLFAPLNIYFQQTFMIESTVVTLHLLSLYFWIKYAQKPNSIGLLLNIIFTSLAFIQKSVYAPFLILPIICTRFSFPKTKKFITKSWIIGLIIPILCLLIWQSYVNVTNIANGHMNFSLEDAGQQLWNFGTIYDRLSVSLWLVRLNAIFGSLTKLFIAAFISGLIYIFSRKNKRTIFLYVWLFSFFCYYLIFLRIQSHEYYFMIIIPVLSIVASSGLYYGVKLFTDKKIIYTGIIAIYLAIFIMKGYQNSLPFFNLNENLGNDLKIINNYLRVKGLVLYVLPQYDWNSVWTYYTDRKGLIIGANDLNEDLITGLKNTGYKYIVLYGAGEIYVQNGNTEEIMKKYKSEGNKNIRVFSI